MHLKRIRFLYLFVITVVIFSFPTISSSYAQSQTSSSQYILDLSRDIYSSIGEPETSLLYDSKGKLRAKLFLSPWGELKDAYISESSGNNRLDSLCLKAIWMHERYQPFPERLGDKDLWIEVPIVFEVEDREMFRTDVKEEWFLLDKPKEDIEVVGTEKAFDIAFENNMAAKIAEEEVQLSRLKIREARRALYPAASLTYMETTGRTTAQTQDFTDKEYKFKFEYPLYYGWRLKYAVDQAVSNMKASRHNYDSVLQDLRLEVETAFYSYIASKVNLRLQRALQQETEKVFSIAKKRYDVELSTKSEFLQIRSQYKQIGYQVASSENDVALAKLTLAQAMRIKPEDIDGLLQIDIDVDLEPMDLDISVDECLDLAIKNRPDLKSKEYMVEFNDYEQKIARSKDQMRVDLTGTIGKSGGAYQSEGLSMSEDWYLGLKVSKPLGGNTLSASYTKDETTEKHGQSSRTESESQGLEFALLDNLQSFSEKKAAEIALHKAREEFNKTKDTVFKEVRESYLNFKKSVAQVNSNLNKIRYREQELTISKARAELNELPLSELIQAHINLTDEKLFYIEALGNLYQSLAKLNKATGYSLFLDTESFRMARIEE